MLLIFPFDFYSFYVSYLQNKEDHDQKEEEDAFGSARICDQSCQGQKESPIQGIP